MALDFPNSPSVNDSFSAGGKTWVYNGTKWVLLGVSLNQTVADGAITTAKLASDSVTTAKITDANITAAKLASSAVTEAKIGSGAVTQAKLTSGLSGITVTTSSLVGTVITSPFTNQFAFFSDTNVLSRWNGTAWVSGVASAPTEAPTGLTLDSATTTTATISFAAGADGGLPISNYQYALSTNGGSSYGSYNALNPADATSPITITGLTGGTAYYIKLKAVNAQGVSNIESNALSFSTIALTFDYLVVAGGGGGNSGYGGGGAGGYRHSYGTASGAGTSGGGGACETALTLSLATNYTVTVGAGGAVDNTGINSTFSTVTSLGGGRGTLFGAGGNGGSGGGSGDAGRGGIVGAGTTGQGYAGGLGSSDTTTYTRGGGGGGAGGVGIASIGDSTSGIGGVGIQSSITGTATYRAGGGGGTPNGAGGSGGGGAASAGGGANTGGGGGASGAGGSGVVILRYSSAFTITIGAGLTGTTATDGSSKVTTITAGSGNVSWA